MNGLPLPYIQADIAANEAKWKRHGIDESDGIFSPKA